MTTVRAARTGEKGQARPGGGPGDRRAARRAAARAFRPRRVVPSVIVAALLAVTGGLTAAVLISRFVGHPVGQAATGTLAQAGRIWHWSDQRVLVLAGALVAIGLALIAFALIPGRLRVVPVAGPDAESVMAITPAGLRRYLAAAATGVDGVSAARVQLGRRRARVLAHSPLRDPAGLEPEVRAAVQDRLDAAAPLRPVKVSVVIRHREE